LSDTNNWVWHPFGYWCIPLPHTNKPLILFWGVGCQKFTEGWWVLCVKRGTDYWLRVDMISTQGISSCSN
jgi:hypothetical protein